jgi:hypothetical protein
MHANTMLKVCNRLVKLLSVTSGALSVSGPSWGNRRWLSLRQRALIPSLFAFERELGESNQQAVAPSQFHLVCVLRASSLLSPPSYKIRPALAHATIQASGLEVPTSLREAFQICWTAPRPIRASQKPRWVGYGYGAKPTPSPFWQPSGKRTVTLHFSCSPTLFDPTLLRLPNPTSLRGAHQRPSCRRISSLVSPIRRPPALSFLF